MFESKVIKLPDGRALCFAEFGSEKGLPLIYFHGFPGSRLEAKRFHEIAVSNDYRLISVDRPGMGQSTMDSNRTILSWVDDVIDLVDHLELEKFSILGHSGACPYVAACALKIPHRLRSAVVVSGVAPFEDPDTHIGMMKEQLIANKLVKRFPFLSSIMMRITRLMLMKSDKILDKMIKNLPEVDKKVFLDPEKRSKLIESTLEAFHNGVAGPAFEMNLVTNPWGFNLSDIQFPVSIWHGAEDTQVPISHGRLYSRQMKKSTFHEVKNEGHHSLILNHFDEIIRSL
ncbi:MAG: alpha/beta fold hydrolase [Gammaproteobacteria bacterium]